jgi:type II secretory pathway pseudopilin PulG
MHDTARRTRTFTLIELTVLLVLLVTLVLVLAPTIANYMNDSRLVRARTDCRTLADGIVRFYRDTSLFPQWVAAPPGASAEGAYRLDLLVTDGDTPGLQSSTMAVLDTGLLAGWTTGRIGKLADQLTTNAPGYVMRTTGAPGGWNGPYLPAPIGPDPWDNQYIVNVGLLGGDGATMDSARSAVWALSAGPNGTIDTAFRQSVATASLGGDDIAVRIQ